jgi:hypothetical protein
MCARVDNQRSRGVVIARLRSSVRSLLHQCRDLHQSAFLYLMKDQEPTSHQSRTVGGGSVLGNKRASAWRFQNFAKFCKRESRAWNFSAWAPNARCNLITWITLFPRCKTRVIRACLVFHWKGRWAHSSVSRIWSKSEMRDIQVRLPLTCTCMV